MAGITIRLERWSSGRGGEPLCGPLDLVLRAGEALSVTGANGTGKSTLLRTLAGLVPPLGGTMRIQNALGPDGEPARELREAAHYLGHRNALKGAETLRDNLLFAQALLRGGRPDAGALTDAIAAAGLGGLEALPAAHLSAGQQRRAALARLLVAPRPVWLLDEPTAALDEASRSRFAAMAERHLSKGGILVAATHLPLCFPARELPLGQAGVRA